MEGEYAEEDPLTLAECAKVAEECLTKRLSVSSEKGHIATTIHFRSVI